MPLDRHRCPECGSVDLRVAGELNCRIEPVEGIWPGQSFERLVPVDPEDIYWDDATHTVCQNESCGYDGPAKDFDPSRKPQSP